MTRDHIRPLGPRRKRYRFIRQRFGTSAWLAEPHLLLYAVILNLAEAGVIIPFTEIRNLIPTYIFNEFGQLTGHFVRYDEIICESGDGRVKIWLNQDALNEQDHERLICDYAESDLRGYVP